MASSSTLPPLSTVLKGKDVEDPFNVYVERPLAYAFVWAVYRTPVTPNFVTVTALLCGVGAAGLFLVGTPAVMVLAGLLLWTSSILDGADGILARAKRIHSQFGRALDGSADMIVAATTVVAGFAHIWFKHHDPLYLWLALPVVLLTLPHIYLYDFYKESFLTMTRPDHQSDGSPEKVAESLRGRKMGWLTRLAMTQLFIPFLQGQVTMARFLNPFSLKSELRRYQGSASADLYQRNNAGPMKLWALISLAPHTYLLAACAVLDRVDLYLWIRLIPMNLLFLVAVFWQRRATRKTLEALSVRV